MKVFNMINEDFVCENCGEFVKKSDYTARDHCPICLYSKHLDINPGDRANECRGLMEPIGVEKFKDTFKIIYKCRKCGEMHRNIVLRDDNMDEIINLSVEKK